MQIVSIHCQYVVDTMTNMPLPCAFDHWDSGFPEEFPPVVSDITGAFDAIWRTPSFQIVWLL